MPDGIQRRFWVGLAAVTILIGSILGAYFFNVVNTDTARLLVSSILAVATFAYVLLTRSMAITMREEMELTKKQLKHRRKSDIIQIIQEEIQPVMTDVRRIRETFKGSGLRKGPDEETIGDETYDRLPEISTKFDRPQDAAWFSDEVDVDAGDVYKFYHTVQKYQEVYNNAVLALTMVILQNTESLDMNEDSTRAYAKSALTLEPVDMGQSEWDAVKTDILPLRSEIPERIDQLMDLKREIRVMGHHVNQDLGASLADLKQDYPITESDL